MLAFSCSFCLFSLCRWCCVLFDRVERVYFDGADGAGDVGGVSFLFLFLCLFVDLFFMMLMLLDVVFSVFHVLFVDRVFFDCAGAADGAGGVFFHVLFVDRVDRDFSLLTAATDLA